MRIGIMQGRLLPPQGAFQSFPRSGWDREFGLAAQAGLDAIEWIFDVGGADQNVLLAPALGVEEHAAAVGRHI